MTGVKSRFWGKKTAVAALAILYAATALAVLSTASPIGDRQALEQRPAVTYPGNSPLGR